MAWGDHNAPNRLARGDLRRFLYSEGLQAERRRQGLRALPKRYRRFARRLERRTGHRIDLSNSNDCAALQLCWALEHDTP